MSGETTVSLRTVWCCQSEKTSLICCKELQLTSLLQLIDLICWIMHSKQSDHSSLLLWGWSRWCKEGLCYRENSNNILILNLSTLHPETHPARIAAAPEWLESLFVTCNTDNQPDRLGLGPDCVENTWWMRVYYYNTINGAQNGLHTDVGPAPGSVTPSPCSNYLRIGGYHGDLVVQRCWETHFKVPTKISEQKRWNQPCLRWIRCRLG